MLVVASDVTSGEASVHAVDARRGPPAQWVHDLGAGAPTTAVSTASRRAFVGTSDLRIRALDLATGEDAWAISARDAFGPRQVPAASSASLVIADRTHVSRVDPSEGETLWAFPAADLKAIEGGGFNNLLQASPVVVGSHVVVGTALGGVSAIEMDSGHRVWRGTVGEDAVGGLAIGHGRVFVSVLGPDGGTVALEHDPEGRLVDEAPPTVLSPGNAVLNFALATVPFVVGAAALSVLVGRRPRRRTVVAR